MSTTPYLVHDEHGNVAYYATLDSEQDPASVFGPGALFVVSPPLADVYVVDGLVVEYTQDQAAAKAVRPANPARWSNAEMRWIDMRSLADAKSDRWRELKAARDAAEFGPFTWDGSTFDGDSASQSRIQGAAQLAMLAEAAGQGLAIDWTLADNTVRTLGAADLIAVGVAMGEHIAAAHAIGRALRQQIEEAATFDAVAAVAWPA